MSKPSAFNANVKFPSPQNKSATRRAPDARDTTNSRSASAPATLGCKNAPDGYGTVTPENVTVGCSVCFITLSFQVMRMAGNVIAASRNSGVKYGTDDVIATSIPLSHCVTRHAPAPPHGNAANIGKMLFISSTTFGQ